MKSFRNLSITKFQIFFTIAMVILLVVSLVLYTTGLKNYERESSKYEFSMENKYLVDNFTSTINNLVYTMLAYSTHSELLTSNNSTLEQHLHSLTSNFNMISSVYVVGVDGTIGNSVGGLNVLAAEVNPMIMGAYTEILTNFDKGLFRGKIVTISDSNLIPIGDHNALIIVQPIYEKNSCEWMYIHPEYRVPAKCVDADVLGFVVAVVPYATMQANLNITMASSGIDSNNLVISPVQGVGLQNISRDQNPFVKENSILVRNPFFTGKSEVYVTLSSNEYFVSQTKHKIKYMIIGFSILILSTLIVFAAGLFLTLKSFSAIRQMISRNQLDQTNYTFTPTFISEASAVDKLLYELWCSNKSQLKEINSQGSQLDEYRRKLEQRNNNLSSQLSGQIVQLNKTMSIKADMLASYRYVVELSEFMNSGTRNAAETGRELLRCLTGMRLVYRFGFKVSFGKDGRFFHKPENLNYDFKTEHIDYSKRFYSQKINDTAEFMVFPIKSMLGFHSWVYFELENGAELSVARTDGIALICKVLTDYIDNTSMRRNLEHLAVVDELTGLNNRNAYISDRSSYVTTYNPNTKLGVFLVDVNGLKQMNDTYGHKAGDWLLKECSIIFNTCIIGMDNVKIYRIGGDEFAISIIEPIKNQVENIRQHFISEMKVKRLFDEKEYFVSFSFGFSQGTINVSDDIVANADAELYRCKKDYYNGNRDRREDRRRRPIKVSNDDLVNLAEVNDENSDSRKIVG